MKNGYFDYNSTTPVDPAVVKVIFDTIENHFGNPSSIHFKGRNGKELIEIARQQVADLIGASRNEVYFTSGGTESNNWALKGLKPLYEQGKNHVITSMTEHSSVYESAKALKKQGIEVTFLPVDKAGKINMDKLRTSIKKNTALISIMTANNETGVLQDMATISSIAGENGIILHSDAIQGAGKIPLNVNTPPVDLLSLSSHKLYGPMGIGALYVRRGITLSPLIDGGGQERKLRSGTENVPLIVGFGEACRLSLKNIHNDGKHLMHMKNILYRGLREKIKSTKLNGSLHQSLPNTLSMSFPGCESETLVLDLDTAGFQVSSGSACGSLGQGKSRVLKAMGLKSSEIFSSIRFSMGRETGEDDVLKLVDTLDKIIRQFV
ncbi:MAG: cysteine desulfurase [Spirochaetaceae bacterium]|nr:cysteine desulfurase [Spirochaetaceae bacterium]